MADRRRRGARARADRRRRQAAAALPGDRPLNGPWLIEVFRHPAHRGVGRALCERALALATVPRLSLMVSEGNSARRLYEDLGFRVVHTALVVEI
jgi:GNAT superfamily N-acetyltransferase